MKSDFLNKKPINERPSQKKNVHYPKIRNPFLNVILSKQFFPNAFGKLISLLFGISDQNVLLFLQ